jgi:hypothetical protein
MNTIITQETYMRILRQADSVIGDFLMAYPADKDRAAFEKTLQQIKQEHVKLSGSEMTRATSNSQTKKGNKKKSDPKV